LRRLVSEVFVRLKADLHHFFRKENLKPAYDLWDEAFSCSGCGFPVSCEEEEMYLHPNKVVFATSSALSSGRFRRGFSWYPLPALVCKASSADGLQGMTSLAGSSGNRRRLPFTRLEKKEFVRLLWGRAGACSGSAAAAVYT
jgi:hypothetical protein